MAQLMGITTALTALNVLLLLSILFVDAKNYSRIKTGFTAGLLLFALVFLVQNLVSLYFFATMMPYFVNEVELHVFLLTGLQTIAFIVLNWVTWK